MYTKKTYSKGGVGMGATILLIGVIVMFLIVLFTVLCIPLVGGMEEKEMEMYRKRKAEEGEGE